MDFAAFFLSAFLAGASGFPASPPSPAVTPVQAQLLADLQARQLKVGKVRAAPWRRAPFSKEKFSPSWPTARIRGDRRLLWHSMGRSAGMEKWVRSR
jgi:hypothetical protein